MRVVLYAGIVAWIFAMACGSHANPKKTTSALDDLAKACDGTSYDGLLYMAGDVGAKEVSASTYYNGTRLTTTGEIAWFCSSGFPDTAYIYNTMEICGAPIGSAQFSRQNIPTTVKFEEGKTYTFGNGASDTGSLFLSYCPAAQAPLCNTHDGDFQGSFKVTRVQVPSQGPSMVLMGFSATDKTNGAKITGCAQVWWYE